MQTTYLVIYWKCACESRRILACNRYEKLSAARHCLRAEGYKRESGDARHGVEEYSLKCEGRQASISCIASPPASRVRQRRVNVTAINSAAA